MKISIFGLGYVGAVSLACLARDGHQVIGVDIDATKLQLIKEGKTPVVEEGMVDLMQKVAASGLVTVTTDVAAAVQGSEISLICVGTPSAANGSQDQGAVLRLAESLGKALATKSDPHVIVFRSTLVPGTVEGVLIPLLEQHSGKKDGIDFFSCFQPEFLREGSSIKDYDKPPFTIVGGRHALGHAKLRELFGHLPCMYLETSVGAAEMMKYCCNNFHALKITFANETARLCASLGVDPFEVMDLVCQDTQLNISRAYLKPGFAFGGSCLPKDLRATSYLAKLRDVELPMLSSILASNEAHLRLAYEAVLETLVQQGSRKVAFLGLSFKTGTDDLRESPLVTLAERLIGKGVQLAIYDPEVQLAHLLGANRRYIEQHLPHIGELLNPDLDAVLGFADCLVVGNSAQEIVAAVSSRLRRAGCDRSREAADARLWPSARTVLVRRFGFALALVLLWASLAVYGLASTDLVRIRNALHFAALDPAEFEWTPNNLPADFLLDRLPPSAEFTALAQRLRVGADDDWTYALAISRHLLASAAKLQGSPVMADLAVTYRLITEQGKGYCADFVRVFQAIAVAGELPMRSWAFSFDGYGGHGHIVVEIWNRQLRRWQLLDVFNNVFFVDDAGQVLSAAGLRRQMRTVPPLSRPLVVGARPGFIHKDKLLDYYKRGLDQWYLWWGNNPFTLDHFQQGPSLLRPLQQAHALVAGAFPAPRALAEPGNAELRSTMTRLRWHLLAVALLTLPTLLGIFWPRRRRHD